jgi:hypothetical protein
VTGTRPRRHRPSAGRPDANQQGRDNQPGGLPGNRRPPDYVIVIAASSWVKDRFPAAGANLRDTLRAGQDRRRGPEPDLEAEP